MRTGRRACGGACMLTRRLSGIKTAADFREACRDQPVAPRLSWRRPHLDKDTCSGTPKSYRALHPRLGAKFATCPATLCARIDWLLGGKGGSKPDPAARPALSCAPLSKISARSLAPTFATTKSASWWLLHRPRMASNDGCRSNSGRHPPRLSRALCIAATWVFGLIQGARLGLR